MSVVITTYNRACFLQAALTSAVGQTYENLEIIVSDNHSSEASFEAIQEVVDGFDDDRIVLKQRDDNVGLQHNNVWALRDANGTYVANLHDDDVWEPTFVEHLVAGLEAHPEATLAFCDHYLIDETGKVLPEATDHNTRHWKRHTLSDGLHQPFARIGLIDRSIPGVMGAMYRHAAIPWDAVPEPATAYDLWLIYLACREGAPAFYTSERLTRYRVHDRSQTSRGLLQLHHDLAYCYERMAEDPRLSYLHDELLYMASAYHCSIGATYLRADDRGTATRHLRRASKLHWNRRSVAGQLLRFVPTALAIRLLDLRRDLFVAPPTTPGEDTSDVPAADERQVLSEAA